MLNVHDNELVSYVVDLRHCKIILSTVCQNSDSITSIEFTDVLAHVFETQLQGSIILDISTMEIRKFIEQNKELLEKQKSYGWPRHYETVEDLLNYLQKERYNYYVVSASYGLNGWIVAKECRVVS